MPSRLPRARSRSPLAHATADSFAFACHPAAGPGQRDRAPTGPPRRRPAVRAGQVDAAVGAHRDRGHRLVTGAAVGRGRHQGAVGRQPHHDHVGAAVGHHRTRSRFVQRVRGGAGGADEHGPTSRGRCRRHGEEHAAVEERGGRQDRAVASDAHGDRAVGTHRTHGECPRTGTDVDGAGGGEQRDRAVGRHGRAHGGAEGPTERHDPAHLAGRVERGHHGQHGPVELDRPGRGPLAHLEPRPRGAGQHHHVAGGIGGDALGGGVGAPDGGRPPDRSVRAVPAFS